MGLKLGFLTTARINAKVMAGAQAAGGIDVVAIGSRDPAKGAAQAAQLGVPRALGSYEELLAAPDVEAVYIALPNALHAEWATRALEAGKHVLVEKPFTTDPAIAERCFDLAAERGLVLMEGFMWRHGEQTRRLVQLVRQGAVGELRVVRAAFSFVLDRDNDVRSIAALGGGSLLDVGTYCVNAARLLAGEPQRAQAWQRVGPSGIDLHFAALMQHRGEVVSEIDCGFDTAEMGLRVVGSAGSITLRDPWHATRPVLEIERNGDSEQIELDRRNQYGLELTNFAAAIRGDGEALLGRDDAIGQARALKMLRSAAAAASQPGEAAAA